MRRAMVTSLTAGSLLLWTSIIVGPLIYVGWVLVSRLRKFRQFAKHFDNFPTAATRHWLFGDLHLAPDPSEASLTFMRNRANERPEGVGQFWYGPFRPSIAVSHPDTIKTILKTSEPKPLDIGGYVNILPWLGEGLLTSRGQKWARNRRLLTPAFHFDILRPYMTVNNRCTDVFLDKLEKFGESGEYFEVFQHVSQLTLDIVLRCAFSYDNDCQVRGDSHPYVTAVDFLQDTIAYRTLRPWLYPSLIFYLTPTGRKFKRHCDYVHGVSNEIMQKRKQTLMQSDVTPAAKKSHRYLDFLDILLTARDESGQGLSDQEIRDEVDTFLFEGHDTTGSGISWALYALAEHPEHQQRCQEEIDEVLADQPDRDIEWDDLPQLKYLTMCLKEALRYHSPVPYIERQTTQDMTVAGRFLPAGSLVSIIIYALHHNDRVWEDAEEYRPDRFSDENINKKDSFAFVPFSAGPRNCIGQHFAMHEMKTAIARILHRSVAQRLQLFIAVLIGVNVHIALPFTLVPDPERVAKHRPTMVMKTESGMYLKVMPRKPNEKPHQFAASVADHVA